LRSKGYNVEVFESNSYPGGKIASFNLGDYRFDAGPSLFTMPNFVDELFDLFGENSKEHFTYKKKIFHVIISGKMEQDFLLIPIKISSLLRLKKN
jgi:phytoene dehydrogenase-like protein